MGHVGTSKRTFAAFSFQESLAWFLVPSICVTALFPLLLLATHAPSADVLSGILDIACQMFFKFGWQAGCWSLTIYLCSFWSREWQAMLVTAALSFVIVGNIGASACSYGAYKSDRELYRPLTKAELLEREKDYQSDLNTLGIPAAIAGGLLAFFSIYAIRLCRRNNNKI